MDVKVNTFGNQSVMTWFNNFIRRSASEMNIYKF